MISIIAEKQTGKDTLAKYIMKFDNNLKRKSLADTMKIQSISIEDKDWNSNYLKEDIDKSIQDNFTEFYMYCQETFWTIPTFDSHWKEGILKMMDFTKVSPWLQTRKALQEFWDFMKEKTENPYYFSDLFKEEENWDIDNIINTDTRYFTELLTFLEEWGIVVHLHNPNNHKPKDQWHLEHLSEAELWVEESPVWIGINVWWKNKVNWIWRISLEELKKIGKEINRIHGNFKWYTHKQKQEFRNIKEYLNNWFLKASKNFNEKLSRFRSWDNGITEKDLRESFFL